MFNILFRHTHSLIQIVILFYFTQKNERTNSLTHKTSTQTEEMATEEVDPAEVTVPHPEADTNPPSNHTITNQMNPRYGVRT